MRVAASPVALSVNSTKPAAIQFPRQHPEPDQFRMGSPLPLWQILPLHDHLLHVQGDRTF